MTVTAGICLVLVWTGTHNVKRTNLPNYSLCHVNISLQDTMLIIFAINLDTASYTNYSECVYWTEGNQSVHVRPHVL